MNNEAASSFTARLFAVLLSPVVCCVVLGNSCLAQLPATRLDSVFPAGGAPSSTVEVTLTGTNLDDVDQLHFSHPGIAAVRKMAEATPFDEGPQPVDNVFMVTIAADVPPGAYDLRCQGKYGRSNRRTFEVGAIPEFVETEPNGGNDLPAWVVTDSGRTNLAQEVQLPVTINGQTTNGPDVDWYRFAGKAGQRILLEGFCRRIDSRMDLAMTVMTASGQILSESRAGAARDSIVDVTLPADGEYFVKVHDALFAQGPGYVYRIVIAQKPYIDFIFPATGVPGTESDYTVYGRNLPGGQPSPLQIDGRSLEQLNVRIAMPGDVRGRLPLSTLINSHQAGLDGIDYRVTAGNLVSNSMLVVASDMTAIRETPNDDPSAPQQLTLPVAVAGQFFPQRDVDWYQFEAKKDDEWIIDILSQRLGGTSDPALLVQQIVTDDKGVTTYRDLTFLDDIQERNINNRAGRHEFDERSGDPTYAFKAPADGKYRLMLRDGISAVRSDPRLVYQLEIRKARPDFRLVAIPSESYGSLLLRKGGRTTIHLVAFRNDGFLEEIRVAATGMPEGVTAEEVVIGPGNDYGTLILTASDAAKGIGTLQITA
ncbi:MAG: PPC domain-containing protein, partial [Planctomycetaceae bacterium]|nr:PPC domain-containing protein [Planctomycetaceae bacterium]